MMLNPSEFAVLPLLLAQFAPWLFLGITVVILLAIGLAWAWAERVGQQRMAAMIRTVRGLIRGELSARTGLKHDDQSQAGRLTTAIDELADAFEHERTGAVAVEQTLQDAFAQTRKRLRKRTKRVVRIARRLETQVEALRESQARYRAVIGQTADAFYLATVEDKRVLEFNPAFRRMLGYTSQEARALSVYDFVDASRQSVDATFEQLTSSASEQIFIERKYRRKDGSLIEVEVGASTLVYRGREVVCCVVHDLTERKRHERELREKNTLLEELAQSEREAHQQLKQAQAQLVQSEKLVGLGQMVAGVAHEINNPLAFVSNNVAVLQRDLQAINRLMKLYEQGNESLKASQPELMAEIADLSERIDLPYTRKNIDELLQRSRDGLKRIQQIVKDLRDFARLDESDLNIVDLNAGLESTLNIIRPRATKKDVKIETELGSLPRVECYPAKVNQVFMNLIANAIDASPQGGKVVIRTSAVDSIIIVHVIDRGQGIDPAIRARIFDPFFTTKPQGEGTGLGLSISYGIVQDHGGTIEVDSEPGQGATFTVRLPTRHPMAVKPS